MIKSVFDDNHLLVPELIKREFVSLPQLIARAQASHCSVKLIRMREVNSARQLHSRTTAIALAKVPPTLP